MTHAGTAATAGPRRRETGVVLALAVLAALRVFLFSAAFPFFTNVDEDAHFDLVHKYARGHVPAGIEPFDPAAVRDMAVFGSPEYLAPAGGFPEGVAPPPVWTLPDDRFRNVVEVRVAEISAEVNYEATQPPVYYLLAGLWYRVGWSAGLRGGAAMYWVRFLNALFCALLTWLAYQYARLLFPSDRFLRFGMPLLVAFFPQDVLFSVNNDVLLPLVGGAALLCLLRLLGGPTRGLGRPLWAGLLVAAAVLVKLSALPLVGIAACTAIVLAVRSRAAGRNLPVAEVAALLLSMAVPLAAWAGWNLLVLGDPTGTADKARILGWSLKPWRELFDHPVFSLAGLATFWSETLATFWRGEFTWGMQRIAVAGWDSFFVVSSAILPAVAVAGLVWQGRQQAQEQLALWVGLAMFLLSLAFLAGVSLAYDFADCFYPSRAHPFLTSGRLALSALLPFVALYLRGWETLLPGPRLESVRWTLLLALVLSMTLTEVGLSLPAFGSRYNWFHLPATAREADAGAPGGAFFRGPVDGAGVLTRVSV